MGFEIKPALDRRGTHRDLGCHDIQPAQKAMFLAVEISRSG